MTDIWRPIVGWERLYEVSNRGHVRNARGRLRKPKPTKVGYLRMTLCLNNKRFTMMLHRLVAAAFIGPCPDGMEVNHKDGNKSNNVASNLEYLTTSGNKLHAIQMGLCDPTLNLPADVAGERNPRAKLTPDDVRYIRLLAANGARHQLIADLFNLAKAYVTRIVGRQTWAAVA